MDNKNPIQSEQYFTEYFNLKKKKEEFLEKKAIIVPKSKKYFSKIKGYFIEDRSDSKAAASDFSRYSVSEKKYNIGAKIKRLNYSMDGAEEIKGEEESLNAGVENGEKPEAESTVENIPDQPAVSDSMEKKSEGVKRGISKKVIIRTVFQSIGAFLSIFGMIFGILIMIFFVALTVLLWVVGVA